MSEVTARTEPCDCLGHSGHRSLIIECDGQVAMQCCEFLYALILQNRWLGQSYARRMELDKLAEFGITPNRDVPQEWIDARRRFEEEQRNA